MAAGGIWLVQSANAAPAVAVDAISQGTDASKSLTKALPLDQLGDGGVEGKVVQLASTPDGTFWAARDKAGNYCLISNPKSADLYSVACADAEQLGSGGIWVSTESGPLAKVNVYLEAYLVPDGAKASEALTAVGLHQIAPNLVVGDTRKFRATTDAVELGSVQLDIPEVPAS